LHADQTNDYSLINMRYFQCCIVRYFDEDRRKCDYARSILRKIRRGLDWFRPSQRVISLYLVSLYYAVEKLVAPDEL
jgi:hypothetical protein